MSATVGSPIRQKRQYHEENYSTMSPLNRSKRSRYEEDMIAQLGYYCDPSRPNLFFLSPGPAVLEIRKDPLKRHQSKVRAILPPRSQSLFTTPSIMIPSTPSFSDQSLSPADFEDCQLFSPTSPSTTTDVQETDEEILSTLASIASFDDEISDIEAVFLHFNDE